MPLNFRLLGNKPGLWAEANKRLNQTHPQFGVSTDGKSHTNETSFIVGRWLGKPENPCVTIMDTPGIGDSEGRDCEHAVEISKSVNKLGDINVFLLLIKSDTNRIDAFLQSQLNLFEEMFGNKFWDSVVIEITYWGHSQSQERDRLRKIYRDELSRGTRTREQLIANKDILMAPNNVYDEKHKTDWWNIQLKVNLKIVMETRSRVPVVFIDPVFDDSYPNWTDPMEQEAYERETSKLWNLTQFSMPYVCEDVCSADEFLDGVPLLMSKEGRMGGRIDRKIQITWQIWFGDCFSNNMRSYTIQFKSNNGNYTDIYRMIDTGENQNVHKFESFPADSDVIDRCSKEDEHLQCLSDSKYKRVTLVIRSLREDSLGHYLVKNDVGQSHPVHSDSYGGGFTKSIFFGFSGVVWIV